MSNKCSPSLSALLRTHITVTPGFCSRKTASDTTNGSHKYSHGCCLCLWQLCIYPTLGSLKLELYKNVCSETWNWMRLTQTGIWFYMGKSGEVHLESCEGSWTLWVSKGPVLNKPRQTFSGNFKQLCTWEQRYFKINTFDRKSIGVKPGGFNSA